MVTEHRFTGRIAGFGTASGTRIVVGIWAESPLGAFTDVMLQDVDGHRTLLAPSDEIAEFVSSTYSFDEVRVVPITTRRVDGGIAVTAGDLSVRMRVGGLSTLGRLLRVVPSLVATHPAWLRVIDPVASRLVAGVHTAGTAGNGRREFYGVTLIRDLDDVVATRSGESLGAMTPLDPPVTFGFGSAPPAPSIVDVVTTIRE
ncbi:hypothetical protein [Agreia sp. Leaf283]|uniref:hypothetical protein n=1 Tax=Agreia sp. Leaf283 TaxID=1736321 RepID=UPI0006FC8132|nr:hypothetical protein [Agreia sp. Leaf283]KQP58015.1 hypothetical protein ASF51_06020 [Agreia sp. Leaf283]